MKVKFETEFESDDIPKDAKGLLQWGHKISLQMLDKAKESLQLELAKFTVAIDAVERDAMDEVPKSVMEWLNNNPPKEDEMPKVVYDSTPSKEHQQSPGSEASEKE